MCYSIKECSACTDVMGVDNCGSDHYMVRAKVRLIIPELSSKKGRQPVPLSVHMLHSSGQVDSFCMLLNSSAPEQPIQH